MVVHIDGGGSGGGGDGDCGVGLGFQVFEWSHLVWVDLGGETHWGKRRWRRPTTAQGSVMEVDGRGLLGPWSDTLQAIHSRSASRSVCKTLCTCVEVCHTLSLVRVLFCRPHCPFAQHQQLTNLLRCFADHTAYCPTSPAGQLAPLG